MFRLKFKLIKHHSYHHHKKHHAHRQVRIGKNWFFLHSVPNPSHPDYEEQKKICHEVIEDLVKYGLLDLDHSDRVWKISRDVHIPSLRYYLCSTYSHYRFRLKAKRYWFKKLMDVQIFVEQVHASSFQPTYGYYISSKCIL